MVNRYDAENIDKALFDSAVNTVFSEPQVDNVSYEVPVGDVRLCGRTPARPV